MIPVPSVSHLDDPQYELGLDCGLRDLNWLYLRKFLLELEREFDQQREYVAYLATRWLTAYDMVRSYQESVILCGNPSEFEKHYFAACIAEIKGKGIHLLNMLQQNVNLDLHKLLGFSSDDVAAMVRELEISEGAVYRAMTDARKNEIAEALGAPRSPA